MLPDLTPTRKVGTAGATGAASVVLIWALGLIHVDMPAEVAAAVTALVATGAAYLTKQNPT